MGLVVNNGTEFRLPYCRSWDKNHGCSIDGPCVVGNRNQVRAHLSTFRDSSWHIHSSELLRLGVSLPVFIAAIQQLVNLGSNETLQAYDPYYSAHSLRSKWVSKDLGEVGFSFWRLFSSSSSVNGG